MKALNLMDDNLYINIINLLKTTPLKVRRLEFDTDYQYIKFDLVLENYDKFFITIERDHSMTKYKINFNGDINAHESVIVYNFILSLKEVLANVE